MCLASHHARNAIRRNLQVINQRSDAFQQTRPGALKSRSQRRPRSSLDLLSGAGHIRSGYSILTALTPASCENSRSSTGSPLKRRSTPARPQVWHPNLPPIVATIFWIVSRFALSARRTLTVARGDRCVAAAVPGWAIVLVLLLTTSAID